MKRLLVLMAVSAVFAVVVSGIAGADTTTTTSETTTTTVPGLDCGTAAVGGTIDCDLTGLAPTAAVVKDVNGVDSEARVTNPKGEIHFHLGIDSTTTAKLDHATEVVIQCGPNTLSAWDGSVTEQGNFTVDCPPGSATPTTATTDPNQAANTRNGRLRAGPLVPAAGPARAVAAPRAATPAAAAANCDPSYPDFCIPAGQQDLDCDQVGRANFTVKPPDPYGFDEGDGIGCVDDSLGKDAVVPPDSGASTPAAPSSAAPTAPKAAAPVAAPTIAAGATSNGSSASNLAKTGLSVARQAGTGGLLLAIGFLFVSWSRRSAEDRQFL